MPGRPMGAARPEKCFFMIFSHFGNIPGEPFGDQGVTRVTRNPQKGLKILPQTLLEVLLVAKRWPEQTERELVRKTTYFEGPGNHQNVVKTK